MKKLTTMIIVVSILFSYGLFLNRYSLTVTKDTLVSENPIGFYDYRGVINVHSKKSTGSGGTSEILRAAKNANLDFIIFNELNLWNRKHQTPNYTGHLLVSYDNEYSYRNSRLLNLMNTESASPSSAAQAQLTLSDTLSKIENSNEKGLYVIAHPLRPRYQWQGEIPEGIDGIELINLKAIWQNAWLHRKASFIWTLFTYLFNERLALMRLVQEPNDVVRFWDDQSQTKKLLAFAGADAESKFKISKNIFLKFPSYETLFSIATNHVLLTSELTGNASDDHKKVADALKSGSFYLSIDTLANPKGFNVTIEEVNGKVHAMGSAPTLSEGMELVIQLPQKPKVPFDVLIYRNGESVFTSNALSTKWVIHEPGVYRVKVRVIPTFPLPDGKKWIPWIYSNNFYVAPPA